MADGFIRGQVRDSSPILLGASKVSAGEMDRAAGRAAALFRASGLAAGDCVAVASARDRVVLEVLVGGMQVGLTVFVLDPDTGAAAANQALLQVDAKGVVADDERATAWGLTPDLLGGRLWRHKDATGGSFMGRLLGRKAKPDAASWHGQLAGHTAESLTLDHPPDTRAAILRTSGTSGVAHLPILTHGNFESQASVACEALGLDGSSRFLVPSPASHIDGIAALFLCWRRGVAVVRPGPITVAGLQTVLDGVYKHRVTHAMLVPSFLRLARRVGVDLRAAFDTPDFVSLLSTAEPLPESLWRSLEDDIGRPLGNVYGMTEVGNILYAGPGEDTREYGTIGHPVGCELRIVDDAGEPVVDGEQGELQLRGPTVCAGYVGEPDFGDWFGTGDLAQKRPSGAIELVGRKTNLLKVAGHRVVPEHVDAVLEAHPAVAEAVSVGVEDPTWGVRLLSAVALASGETAEADAIRRWAAERLADVEVPREVRVLDALPRGRTGKIDRRAVRDALSRPVGGGASDSEIEAQVLALAERIFGHEAGSLDVGAAAQTTRGWDSIAHLDLASALESTFGISLTATDIATIQRLSDAVALVQKGR
jgi:acyl-coenzyme A synthetase/AMP-(fatty) acid ligase/acyl carrier protein